LALPETFSSNPLAFIGKQGSSGCRLPFRRTPPPFPREFSPHFKAVRSPFEASSWKKRTSSPPFGEDRETWPFPPPRSPPRRRISRKACFKRTTAFAAPPPFRAVPCPGGGTPCLHFRGALPAGTLSCPSAKKPFRTRQRFSFRSKEKTVQEERIPLAHPARKRKVRPLPPGAPSDLTLLRPAP